MQRFVSSRLDRDRCWLLAGRYVQPGKLKVVVELSAQRRSGEDEEEPVRDDICQRRGDGNRARKRRVAREESAS